MDLAILRKLFRVNSQPAALRRSPARPKVRLALEGLEDRIALAIHTVSTFADLQFWATHAAQGDTIKVAAGDYRLGGVVNVTVQRLTILGAQTNKEPTMPGRTPAGPAESTVAGFDLQADRIEIEGFTIQNTNSLDHFGDGITTEPNHSGYQILDNIFASNQDAGINLRSNGVFESDIQHNWWDNAAHLAPSLATVTQRPNVSVGGGVADQWDIRDFGADFGPLSNVKIGYNTFTNASTNGSAVDLEGTSTTHLTNIEINQNLFDHSNGIALWNAANADIYDNTMTAYSGTGIWLRNFLDDVEVTDNDLYAAAGSDDGIRIEDATLVQPTMAIHGATVPAPSEGLMIDVAHNSISGGGTVTNPANGEDGIDVIDADESCLTTIEYNTISHMGHDGIHLNNNDGESTVNNNYITYSQFDGIYVDHSNGNLVRDNTSSYNGNAGVYVDSSSGNLIERNHLIHNAYGIYANSTTVLNTFFNNNASNDTVLDYRDSSNGGGTAGTNNFWMQNNGSTANPSGLIN